MIEPKTRLAFSVMENPGVYALLVGSGISRSAEIPTGWDITIDLVRKIAVAEGVTDEVDWEAWHRTRFGTDPGYSSLLDVLSVTPAERRSILHDYIEPSDDDFEAGRRVPTAAHHAIARLVQGGFVRVIVTTNFDRLLETALGAVGIQPIVIKSVDDLMGASPLPHSRCYLLKVHGDYLDNRILNTEAELAAYPDEYARLLDRILDEYGLIVSGWSGDWDPALRSAIARAPNRRYPTWWASRGTPTHAADELISARAATVLPIADADSFFVDLADGVDVLTKARRPAPETIELLIAATKRNLASPDRRIELADAIADETERVLRRVCGPEFPVQVPSINNAVLLERWQALEGIAQPLTRMAGVCGRWGDGSELDHMQSALRTIITEQPTDGKVALIGLATYPAYLLFLSYGLGLTKARRWKDLLCWLTTEVQRPLRSPMPAHSCLFMARWDRVESEWWKLWPGAENHYAPWATHLLEAIVPWSRDFGLMSPEAVENYLTLEILGGIVALNEKDEDHLLALTSPIYTPYGRSANDEDARAKILKRLESADVQPRLLAAGFCQGSANRWKGAVHNLELIAGRMGW